MRPSIEDLTSYYASPRGQRMQQRVLDVLTPMRATRAQDRVLGLGYAAPYVGTLQRDVERLVLAHPQLQGYAAYPAAGPNISVQVDEYALPFADAFFDQVLAVHVLEFSDPARRLLREVWRVLAPRGRLLLVVPNRRSLTALLDTSPFGNGRPFSAAQLEALLKEAMFDVESLDGVAALPHGRGGARADQLLLKLMPGIAGVHIVLAQKADGFIMGTPVRRTVVGRAQTVASAAQR